MTMNRVQFQSGLSLPAFLAQFGREGQCEEALEIARWPQGFRCPECGAAAHYTSSRVARAKPSNVKPAGYKHR